MTAAGRFVVIGTTTVDLFLTGTAKLPADVGVDEFTTDSIALLDDPARFRLGGNGGNTAYALAALGAEVALCSAVGRDELGEMLVGWLSERGVGLDGLVRSETQATSCTAIALDRSLRRLAFHHPGASFDYAPEDIPERLLARPGCVLVTSYHLLRRFRGEPCARLLAAARAAGATTAVDLGPAVHPVASPAELEPLLPEADYVLANAHEVAACTGLGDLDDGARALREAGAAIVVVKRGADGAFLYEGGSRTEAPGFAAEARSTVGAGDAFDAGFLDAVAHGAGPEEALRFANAAAALVVATPDGVLGSPGREEIRRFLAEHA